jgi:hypothetical protein
MSFIFQSWPLTRGSTLFLTLGVILLFTFIKFLLAGGSILRRHSISNQLEFLRDCPIQAGHPWAIQVSKIPDLPELFCEETVKEEYLL